ncbi:hypothetical protein [Ruegeria halocynthiae]|uniref:hypothetical protein n=1 Tax=Ruegeria halocynthiae TaxID=985054 RepID=UPI000563A106|nr:hypothetical protein [Ruegeria halocynthiae]
MTKMQSSGPEAAENWTIYLSGGVGDIMMSLICHRIQFGKLPVKAICAEKQLQSAITVDSLVTRMYFPDQLPASIDAVDDGLAKSLFDDLSDTRELDSEFGPRMLYVNDQICLSRWVYFTRNWEEFKFSASAWLETYARFNRVNEILARNLVLKSEAPKRGKEALSLAVAEGRPIRVNVAIHANSVMTNLDALIDKILGVLACLQKRNPVTLAVHQPKDGLRPDGFEQSSDGFKLGIERLIATLQPEGVTIVDGPFSDVVESLESSNLLIAVRSGTCDIAAALGVPQINYYDDAIAQRIYRHSPTEQAFPLEGGNLGVVAFQNLPPELAGALKKEMA